MEVTIRRITDWSRALNAARMTVHKDFIEKEPSERFKESVIKAEHSPIRLVEYDIVLKGIPYYVAMHLVRHKVGFEPFVATSREDRTGVKREERRQTDLVDCQFSLNAQAFINISRKRLCNKADIETRKVWKAVIKELEGIEPALGKYCVRECVYRGFCPEADGCPYFDTQEFRRTRLHYIRKEEWK